MKATQLLGLLAKNPSEFCSRISMIAGHRIPPVKGTRHCYELSDWETLITNLGKVLKYNLAEAMLSGELTQVELILQRRMELLPPRAPFATFHNGDLMLARLCYQVVRALQPERVIETGVCYGVSSLFILAGLAQNCRGTLDSIDLPPLGRDADRFVGWAIANDELKTRWCLHRGVSGNILPKLLPKVGAVGLFVHDSLHTYKNMRMEFDLVWPYIAPGGVVISDDIHWNRAFQELAIRPDVAFHAVVREAEKDSLLGIVTKAILPKDLPVLG